MTVNYPACGLPIPLISAGELWVDVINGNDATGRRNYRVYPFRYFESALAASSDYDTIHIVPASSVVSSSGINNSSAITINKGLQVICDSLSNDTYPFFLNTTITITLSAAKYVLFKGVGIYNTTLTSPCVTVTAVSSETVLFEDCYLYNATGTPTYLSTSGTWLSSGTGGSATTRSRLILNRCNLFGRAVLGAGTVGSPFDLKGLTEFNSCTMGSATSQPGLIQVNSGAVIVNNMLHCPALLLNGGMLVVRGCDVPYEDGSNNLILANATDTVGKSILVVDGMNTMGRWRDPMTASQAAMGKINIGANVLYSLNNVLIPAGNVVIDASAQEYSTYLSGQGKTTNMVLYNSTPVYGSGVALT
jgi:hypothetical protein